MAGLERLQVLAGGDVVLLGLVRSLVAFVDVRFDRVDQRRLRIGGGECHSDLLCVKGTALAGRDDEC